mgnify:CR=1 FL=1
MFYRCFILFTFSVLSALGLQAAVAESNTSAVASEQSHNRRAHPLNNYAGNVETIYHRRPIVTIIFPPYLDDTLKSAVIASYRSGVVRGRIQNKTRHKHL